MKKSKLSQIVKCVQKIGSHCEPNKEYFHLGRTRRTHIHINSTQMGVLPMLGIPYKIMSIITRKLEGGNTFITICVASGEWRCIK